MSLIKWKRDKKCTLKFKTKRGVRHSKSQNLSNEQVNSNYIEEQVIEYSGDERTNAEGDDING